MLVINRPDHSTINNNVQVVVIIGLGIHILIYYYSHASIIHGFWHEKFWVQKPRIIEDRE